MPEEKEVNVVFVRHGEAQNAELALDELVAKGIAPHTSQLTVRGKRQILCARDVLREKVPQGFERCVSSPYVRAMQSMQLLVEDTVRVRLDPKLRELEQGVWATMRRRDLERNYPGEEERRRLGGYYYRPPCGESWPDLELRAEQALAQLYEAPPGAWVLVVTHGYWYQALERLLFNRSIEQHWHMVSRGELLPHAGMVALGIAHPSVRPKLLFTWTPSD
jgi:broad specificity phosphatase PhoE